MVKKLFIVIITVVMMLAVSGCTSNNEKESQTMKNDQLSGEQTDLDSKTLIVYFSKTGNTEEIAKEIQNLVGGTLVKIETIERYPEEYQETTVVAKREKEENARPQISTKIENMDQYDTIFIGYPIWWHDAPMAIYTFLEEYHFTNKTVIPFCTSGGNSIEESLVGIQNAIEGATLLKGLTANNQEEVQPWLKEIGILK